LSGRDSAQRAVFWSLALLGVVIVAINATAYFGFARARLLAPYPLVWVEPIFFRSALEVFQGGRVFAPPSLDYIAPIYNPGVAWLGGLLFDWLGPGWGTLRALSFVPFLALVVAVAMWSYRETREVGWACAIAILGLATSVSCQFVTTTVNADLPCHLFGIGAVLWIAIAPDSRRAALGAAGCVCIAFVFKQNGAIYGLIVAVALGVRSRRQALLFSIAALAGALVLEAVWAWRSEGWSWVYTFQIAIGSGAREEHRFVEFWMASNRVATLALALSLPIVIALDPARRVLFGGLAAGTLAVSYAGFVKVGGASNSLLPSYWASLVITTAAFAAISIRIPSGWARTAVRGLSIVVLLAAGHAALAPMRERANVLAGVPPGEPAHPRNAHFESRLREAVKAVDGPVFVGARFAAWADLGRPLNTHQVSILEGTDRVQVFDVGALERQLVEHGYAAMLVWDHPFGPTFDRLVAAHYRRTGMLGVDPLAGHRVGIWEPRSGRDRTTPQRKSKGSPARRLTQDLGQPTPWKLSPRSGEPATSPRISPPAP
jgi:hypothetical protein